ncbi:MAG: hypothetical protein OEY22_00760 [Candidatus Bathyarchaeota archaeon]|nr:hypothetical protein [Candidatus Bathyarchaeota archaeon]MDH5788546.1 hypothetical protein [Candidatus Bathyarchaeota archaeon]
MYNDLYTAWKQELGNEELGKLPSDFYTKIAEYLKKLREEDRMLDKRTTKATLLKKEEKNAKRMLRELVQIRYKKLVVNSAKGKIISTGFLTAEEERIYAGLMPLPEACKNFLKNLIHGRVPKMDVKQERRRAVFRFLKDIPAIVGADMKVYGPFKTEDIAALPIENAKILMRQGLAEKVEAD